jgi:hypothetical protein
MRLGLVNPFSEKGYMTKPPEIRPHQALTRIVRRVVLVSVVLKMFCFMEVIFSFSCVYELLF